MRRLCCSRAPQAVQQRVPLDRASVTCCSAAWSMAPAGYNLLPLQNKKYVPERPSNRTAKPKQPTNELRDKLPPNRKRGEGGSQSGGCVCVVGVDSPQPSLVTSANRREAKPTRKKRRTGRADRNKQHKEAPNKHKKRPSQQGGEKPTPQNRTEGSEAGRTNREERGAGGRGQAEASREGKRGRQGRQS